jgi:putative SbcD/Mre11-related phosphoesterase
MIHQSLEVAPGVVLDARRAVWLAESRTLLIADPHLGYAWAHRNSGNLLPLGRASDPLDRLAALAASYVCERIVLLGDVVHDAVHVEPLEGELQRLHRELGSIAEVILIAGNHDRRLRQLLDRLDIQIPFHREYQVGPHRFVHGDGAKPAAARAELATAHDRGGFVVCGHEHPAITLSDRVASYARCPCFVHGDGLLMLPAFSEWAAGNNLRSGDFLSPYLQVARLQSVTAIVAGKLLRIDARDMNGRRVKP